jgi:4-amino-4-deoxy-L-arabinose transferase-like glycosyltransferase
MLPVVSASDGVRAPVSRSALLGVLAFAAAIRLANLWSMSHLPVAEYQLHWPEGDMSFYYDWSGRILAGDWIGRDTPHPFTPWMAGIAPRETWERWWGGRQVFHNAPLYPYLLAGFRLALGDGFWGIAIGQLLVGLAGVALTFLLAARLFGGDAAIAAGLTAALFGPALLYESLALRDGLAATVSLGLLWALVRCRERDGPRWLVAGLLLALALMARENLLVFAPFVAGWAIWVHRGRRRAFPRNAAYLAAGVLLGFLPLVARNVALDVRPWALSPQGVQALALGHVADSGAAVTTITPNAASVLAAADGSVLEVVRQIWGTYAGDWRRLLAKEAERLAATISSFESADNVSWYYFRERSPVLRFTLPFEIVLALATVGLWLERRSLAAHAPLWLFALSCVLALMVTTVIGRYRMPLAAVLAVYAGAALAWTRRRAAERAWPRVAAVVVAVLAVVTGAHLVLPSGEVRDRYRSDEYSLAAATYLQRGDTEAALEELRDGLRAAAREPGRRVLSTGYVAIAQAYATEANRAGRAAEAAGELEIVSAELPDDVTVRKLLGLLYRDVLGRPADAERHLAAAARLEAR